MQFVGIGPSPEKSPAPRRPTEKTPIVRDLPSKELPIDKPDASKDPIGRPPDSTGSSDAPSEKKGDPSEDLPPSDEKER